MMNTVIITHIQRDLEAENEQLRAQLKSLKREISALKADQGLLLAILSEALGTRTVIIREDINVNQTPAFRLEENLGGDIILSLR